MNEREESKSTYSRYLQLHSPRVFVVYYSPYRLLVAMQLTKETKKHRKSPSGQQKGRVSKHGWGVDSFYFFFVDDIVVVFLTHISSTPHKKKQLSHPRS